VKNNIFLLPIFAQEHTFGHSANEKETEKGRNKKQNENRKKDQKNPRTAKEIRTRSATKTNQQR
jgi:hypothetical protein